MLLKRASLIFLVLYDKIAGNELLNTYIIALLTKSSRLIIAEEADKNIPIVQTTIHYSTFLILNRCFVVAIR